MKIIVQKFGGTSVATAENRAAVLKKVKGALDGGYSPVIVVSAMGRRGEPYATDTLIDFLKDVNLSVSAHEVDLLMCCGEVISSCVMAATLQKAGLMSVALTGGQAGIITDSQYGAARIKNIHTSNLLRFLEDGLVPVVCGFQGITENNHNFTTLGRGGSDTTAAALGAVLHAEFVEIYTDVEGIMTADPRLVKDANILKTVTYNEVAQMAHNGAKVIHPRAVEIAMSSNIPLIVKSTFSDAPGTRITNDRPDGAIGADVAFSNKAVTGIANMDGIAQFRIRLNPDNIAAGEKIFREIAKAGVSVSFLNLSEREAMFAVFAGKVGETRAVLDKEGLEYFCNDRCAKVTIILEPQRGSLGLMASFVSALTEKGIAILQTVDSDNTISAIIREECMSEAVRALHAKFEL